MALSFRRFITMKKNGGTFVKSAICNFEKNPNAPITVSYTVFANLAKEIRDVVNDYYGITFTCDGQSELNAYATFSSGLQHSTVYAEWDSEFKKYNCYSYALGITNAPFDPGLITAIANDPSCLENWNLDIPNITIEQICELVIEDLGTRGETRVVCRASQMDTSNLCTNESVICVRKGDEDYHFMRYTADGWLHKPGNTQILKYNSVPTDGTVWTNEAVYMGIFYEATLEYDSTIYFISYNGHDWDYTNNSNGTHNKNCSICGDSFTYNCDYTYAYSSNSDGTHTGTCICGNTRTVNCSLEYTNISSAQHSISCSLCDYSSTGRCSVTYEYASNNQHRGECSKCKGSYLINCFMVVTYCGDETSGDVHKTACKSCGHGSSAGVTACTFAYSSRVNETHVYACTECGHIESGPTPCIFAIDGYCIFCGAYSDAGVLSQAEVECLS